MWVRGGFGLATVALLLAGLASVEACTPRSTSTESAPLSTQEQLSTSNVSANAGEGLVISQLYGGAGQSGALFNRDFVEIFNRSQKAASLKGLSVHYAGSASDFVLAGRLPDSAVIPPGGYYVVGFAGGQSGADLRVDGAGLFVNILPQNGKVALVRDVIEDSGDAAAQLLGCGGSDAGACIKNARIVDLLGYGVSSDHEGSTAAPTPSLTKALLRKGAGCIDSSSNAVDFELGTPAPRTAESARHVCPATLPR